MAMLQHRSARSGRRLAHVPEKWAPVSRLREALAWSRVAGRCSGRRRQVRKGHAPRQESRAAPGRAGAIILLIAAAIVLPPASSVLGQDLQFSASPCATNPQRMIYVA